MKNKKLLSTIIIVLVAVLAITAYSVFSSVAQKPTVTEGEFPFTITYELDGEKVTINEVYKVRYTGNDGYADSKTRIYVGEIGNMGEGNTVYTLKKGDNTRIELCTNFYPEYMMGDCEAGYFDEEPFAPAIYYYDAEEIEYHDEKTLAAQGVKLISFEYPEPIENSFVFSHISHFSGEIVIPTVFIALLALLAIVIFVKKEKDLVYKPIDTVSTVLNFIISFTLLPFLTIVGIFADINGGSSDFTHQIFYFFPALIVLCNAVSIALRRKGYGIKALIAELIGPAVFAVFYVVLTVLEMF